MKNFKTYYKRNLPHYQPPGYTYFVTYRLSGSLPVEVIKKLKGERKKQLKEIAGISNKSLQQEKYKKMQSIYFGKFDKLLDASDYGPTWLKEKEIAQIVKDAIHFYDNKKYDLICYTIMSNHVHQVFTPIVDRISDSTDQQTKAETSRNRVSGYIVTKILQDLKRFTARECNKTLGLSGSFWQHESYDHVVRDYNELQRIVKYVLNNPVKAGLCEKWEDWKWSYCNISYL
ncbi:MAG: transposase [Ignavibacteriaceae bacterium]|nr:transposase [Ignavibacteriaceae bacterium]